MNSNNAILSGATFARMENYSRLTLSSCYATRQLRDRQQGSFVISGMDVPNGVTYEFQGEPEHTRARNGAHALGRHLPLPLTSRLPLLCQR